MAQLMPLPLTVSSFSKIQIGFTFLVLAHPDNPGKRAVKCVCVCVFISYASVSSLFPYLSPPLLIFSFEYRLARFQAGCHERRLNLAVFFVFVLCCIAFLFTSRCQLYRCTFIPYCFPQESVSTSSGLYQSLLSIRSICPTSIHLQNDHLTTLLCVCASVWMDCMWNVCL